MKRRLIRVTMDLGNSCDCGEHPRFVGAMGRLSRRLYCIAPEPGISTNAVGFSFEGPFMSQDELLRMRRGDEPPSA